MPINMPKRTQKRKGIVVRLLMKDGSITDLNFLEIEGTKLLPFYTYIPPHPSHLCSWEVKHIGTHLKVRGYLLLFDIAHLI